MICPLIALITSQSPPPSLDPSRLVLAHDALRQHVREGKIPGAVTLVMQGGKVVHFGTTGYLNVAQRTVLRKDSLFQVMSMTKPVTAIAAMIAVEQGLFGLDDPVENHLPQFRDQRVQMADGSTLPAKSRLTIRQLMTHTSGVSSDDPGGLTDDEKFKLPLLEYAKLLGKEPLRAHPGEEIRYSGVGFSALAAIIELRSGKPFQTFVQEHIFDPLGMKDTFFFLPPGRRSELATVYMMDSGKLVEFEHNRFREGARFANGAGGLYSTASDMGRLIDSFRSGARTWVVSQPTLRLMTTLQTGSLLSDGNDARGYGLGWSVIRSVRGQNTLRSVGSFGHTGAFGTEFWHDPATGVSLVYLTQTFLVDETPRRQFSTMVNASLR